MSDGLIKATVGVTGAIAGAQALAYVIGIICPAKFKEVPFPLVHKSFKAAVAKAASDNKIFGDYFYPNLFSAAPVVEQTFFHDTDKPAQRTKLTKWLALALSLVEAGRLEDAFAAIAVMGARHVAYMGPVGPGTSGAYDLVGATVIKTVTQLAGEELMPKAAVDEWVALYTIIKDKTIAAMQDEKTTAGHLKNFYGMRLKWFVKEAFAGEGGSAAYAEKVVAIAYGKKDDAVVAAAKALFGAAVDEAKTQGSLAPLSEAVKKLPKSDVFATAIAQAIPAIGEGNKPDAWQEWTLAPIIAALEQK